MTKKDGFKKRLDDLMEESKDIDRAIWIITQRQSKHISCLAGVLEDLKNA